MAPIFAAGRGIGDKDAIGQGTDELIVIVGRFSCGSTLAYPGTTGYRFQNKL